jgi:UPF0716 family protein affecting phage T7 exclusion
MQSLWRGTRVVAETILGYLLLVAGAVMLVTPGPGIVTIVAGLAVLSRHFHWADRLKHAAVGRIRDSRTALRARRAARIAGRDAAHGSDVALPGTPEASRRAA